MNKQWKQLKDTIVEIRDHNEFEHEDVTLMCRFLVNYMEMLEADARAEACFQPNSNEKTHSSQQDHNEDIAKAFQFGVAFGFGKRYDELDRVIEEIKKVITPQPKTWHWRHYEGMLICSKCGSEFYDDIMEYCGDDVPKCCPDCGAKMIEPQESEEV